jgi:hypothetical protein
MGKKRNEYQISVGKPEVLRQRWKDNIKINFKVVG